MVAKIPIPLAASWRSKRAILSDVEESRPLVGSSISMSDGLQISS